MKQSVEQVDLDQVGSKRLNDYLLSYICNSKVVSLNPLQFDKIYYGKYDYFQNVRTDEIYFILDHKGKNYTINSDEPDLQIGDWTIFFPTFFTKKNSGLDSILCKILTKKDYYYPADIIYDLSMENLRSVEFEYLIDRILKICDEGRET